MNDPGDEHTPREFTPAEHARVDVGIAFRRLTAAVATSGEYGEAESLEYAAQALRKALAAGG